MDQPQQKDILSMLKQLSMQIVENKAFKWLVVAVIAANFMVLVLETMPREIPPHSWQALKLLDRLFLTFFVVELVLKIVAYRREFFWPFRFWNWFDIVVVVISFYGSFSAFRALRVFLLFNISPSLKREIEVFTAAIFNRNVGSIFAVMMMLVSVAALVMSLRYGEVLPERLYGWHTSFATHFQLIAFDDWGSINHEMNAAIGAWTTIYLTIYSVVMLLITSGLIGIVYDEITRARAKQKDDD